MYIQRSFILLFTTALSISGCSSVGIFDKNHPDPSMIRLAQVAEDMQRTANELSAMESAKLRASNQRAETIDIDLLPGLEKVVSLGSSWSGPADKLIDKLSLLAGLKAPRYLNVKPAGDVIVNVNTDYRRIIDILQDVGAQAGHRAYITLKARERVLIVEYKPY